VLIRSESFNGMDTLKMRALPLVPREPAPAAAPAPVLMPARPAAAPKGHSPAPGLFGAITSALTGFFKSIGRSIARLAAPAVHSAPPPPPTTMWQQYDAVMSDSELRARLLRQCKKQHCDEQRIAFEAAKTFMSSSGDYASFHKLMAVVEEQTPNIDDGLRHCLDNMALLPREKFSGHEAAAHVHKLGAETFGMLQAGPMLNANIRFDLHGQLQR